MAPRAARVAASALTLALAVTGGILARAPRLISFTPDFERASEIAPAVFRSSTTAKPVLTRAVAPAVPVDPPRVASETWVRRRAKAHRQHRKPAAPEFLTTTWPAASRQPAMTITLTSQVIQPEPRQPLSQRVQPIYAPAVLRVPVAYAAVRTPDGWIIFQL
jgi:hypothetical protein